MAKKISALYIGEDAYLYKGHINPEIIANEEQIVEEITDYLEINKKKSNEHEFEIDHIRYIDDEDKGEDFDEDADDDLIKEIETNFEELVKRFQVMETLFFEFKE